MTAHIVIKQGMNAKLALADLTALVQHDFDIFHSTIQIEEAELFTAGKHSKGKLDINLNPCYSSVDTKAKLVCFSHDDEVNCNGTVAR